jgi:hypothetical protein
MNLPDRNISGLVTVADFLGTQHDAVAAAINQARIPPQFEFHVYQGSFRLYVPQEYLEAAREICQSIEQSIMLDRANTNESSANSN